MYLWVLALVASAAADENPVYVFTHIPKSAGSSATALFRQAVAERCQHLRSIDFPTLRARGCAAVLDRLVPAVETCFTLTDTPVVACYLEVSA
jgi:hypothetical protein